MPTKKEEKTTAPTPSLMDRKGNYYYANGKRKTSTALVRLYDGGSGEVVVNNRPAKEYFYGALTGGVKAPLKIVDMPKRFDVIAKVSGGGIAGQADAIRHGVAKALTIFDPALRVLLKRAGFLTRDARVKERKKPGLHRARRAPQWAKR